MKIFLLLTLAPVVGFGQLPQQVNVTVTQDPYTRYTQPFYDSLNQSVQVAQRMREMALGQQQLDEQHRHNLAEEQLQRLSVTDQTSDYRAAHSNEAAWRINQDVKDAINACHAVHEDCEKLDGMMNVISKAVRPDWTQISMAEYVECLYAIAKNATFGEQARAMLSAPAAPAKPAAVPASIAPR